MSTSVRFNSQLMTNVMHVTRAPLTWSVRNALRPNFIWGTVSNVLANSLTRLTGIPTLTAELRAQVIRADGHIIDYGVLGRRVVTTAFVQDLVDELVGTGTGISNYDYHASGTGTAAESASDTALGAQVGSRVTGTPSEAAANIYQNQATISYTGSYAITEHGLFDAATGGTLMDRTVFTAINVVADDAIQFTYKLTPAGS